MNLPEQDLAQHTANIALSMTPMDIRIDFYDGAVRLNVAFIRDGVPIVERQLNSRDHRVSVTPEYRFDNAEDLYRAIEQAIAIETEVVNQRERHAYEQASKQTQVDGV